MVTGIAFFLCTFVVMQRSAHANAIKPHDLKYFVSDLLDSMAAVNPIEVTTLEGMKSALQRVMHSNKNIQAYVSKKYPAHAEVGGIGKAIENAPKLFHIVDRLTSGRVTFNNLRLTIVPIVFSIYTDVFAYSPLNTDNEAVAGYILKRSIEFEELLDMILNAISNIEEYLGLAKDKRQYLTVADKVYGRVGRKFAGRVAAKSFG